MRLILASASPRRRELLACLGVSFDVVPADIDEESGDGERAERVARRLARDKAATVAAQYPGAVVLAADTVVAFRGRLLGKPAGESGAAEMLSLLRGRMHRVVTGVAVSGPGRRWAGVAHVTTRVTMRRYSDAEIAAWVARGHLFDKAGAYAIQDQVFRPVDRYEGCYCNVVGFPLWTVAALLMQWGIPARAAAAGMPSECALCPEREAHSRRLQRVDIQ